MMVEYVTIWRGNRPTKLRWGIPVVRCRDCANATRCEDGMFDCHGPLVQTWDYWNDEPLRNPVPPYGFCMWGVRRIEQSEPSVEKEE
jgi:hypothetical protein